MAGAVPTPRCCDGPWTRCRPACSHRRPRRPGLPGTARYLLLGVLAVGNPWAAETLYQAHVDLAGVHLPPTDGYLAPLLVVVTAVLVGLAWPAWDPQPPPDPAGYWLAGNLRTLVFLAVTVWLLRRLAAAGPVPPGPWRTPAMFAAPLAGAVAGALGGAAVQVGLGEPAVTGRALLQATLSFSSGGLLCAVLAGTLLALVVARSAGSGR
ncbi:hypothetical protein [Micromonospora fluostatini]|uniref:hypothetical protein n=1 Tax=Micromonospora sp. JCM 30529 TaxID=3421643 RepID=UPI003D167852